MGKIAELASHLITFNQRDKTGLILSYICFQKLLPEFGDRKILGGSHFVSNFDRVYLKKKRDD